VPLRVEIDSVGGRWAGSITRHELANDDPHAVASFETPAPVPVASEVSVNGETLIVELGPLSHTVLVGATAR
jgi:hypothetical protein